MQGYASMVKLVDTADLKSAAFLNKGRAGSTPARGTKMEANSLVLLAFFFGYTSTKQARPVSLVWRSRSGGRWAVQQAVACL